ncbi:helix-turn-helix transcriptional regulator [Virgibacillus sp. YIM 98842]|uniref:helix-turn-helix domain-containing protein n=1 Tax=Virgibacillus sp. YIM 98842 TaxID=2663533 RepID=UPI0013DB5973|nr:helix-turn-helix transcriptional regulator [Virgibacillus sp. YIM 98842]
METKRIGRRIKAFRKLKGYTQANFAKELDVSLSFIGAVERGTKEASEKLLNQISSLLSISKEELLLEEGQDHPVIEENVQAEKPDVFNS